MQGGSVYAWWNLTPDQKQKLAEQRQQGMFGGTPGRAPYFWVLEGTHNPEGVAKSGGGKRPTFWVSNAIEESMSGVSDALSRILG